LNDKIPGILELKPELRSRWEVARKLLGEKKQVVTRLVVRRISDLGRRHQDIQNLAAQLDAEKKKAEGNTREVLTINAIQLSATSTALSND